MTIEIPLTQGKVALIDDADWPLVSEYQWHFVGKSRRGYVGTSSFKFTGRKGILYMHRLLMNAPARVEVDHVNSDGLDNRRANLRLATRAQNMANSRKRLTGSFSQYKGVYWNGIRGKWEAKIGTPPNRKYLGIFFDEKDAAKAYDAAARVWFGEFARLNFP